MRLEHLTSAELDAYTHRDLAPSDLLEVSDHLLECAECRERVLAIRPTGGAPEVSYEELASYLDHELDPLARREMESKLARSPWARRELADLIAFREETNAATNPIPIVSTRDSKIVPFFIGRWALPLAAALALSGGALWYSAHSRSDSTTYVRLRDNGRDVRITSSGDSGAFKNLPAPLRGAVRAAVVDGRLHLPEEIAALAGHRGTLAGGTAAPPAGAFRVLAPLTTALRDGKALFRWTPYAEATAYRLHVVSLNTGQLIVSEVLPADRPTWSPTTPLRDGETYEWEIEALKGEQVLAKAPEPPQPEARFAVISNAKRAELEQIRTRSRGSHLALGVANAEAGLFDDAAAEFHALAQENPKSTVPNQLLGEIQRRRLPR
ncbi:MAG: hypothetical protein M3Z64_05880 [Verrucomicrobiota bacterium]|nr:hypothetical protein [Verrucomicrobiota bacterium]